MDGVISSDTIEGDNIAENDKRIEGRTEPTKSYRRVVVGAEERMDGEEDMDGFDPDDDDDDDDDAVLVESDIEGIRVEDQKIGNYDCPILVLSKSEEKRIYKPWKRGIIVKLLGRRIGYKALETRLKQMWVKKGIINIIDLGNDYYLVTFSNELDHATALTNGPWFIYDHYLTVREWSPNFHPQSDTIKKVAVWVRISGLPIEYYDARVLKRIGNTIGTTMKVDKNTLMQERGKYARICVEVDLTKALLAMFMIKGRKYNVEYEGLHLLCKNCGKFGHYSEGCPEKAKAETNRQQEGRMNMPGNSLDGPWMVVQKQRRNRKAKEKEVPVTEGGGRKVPTKVNAIGHNNGSRFAALIDENDGDVLENVNYEGNRVEPMEESQLAIWKKNGAGNKQQHNDEIIVIQEEGANKGKNISNMIENQDTCVDYQKKNATEGMSWQQRDGNHEKNSRDIKLGARVSNFKGRAVSKNCGRATLENIVENIEKNKLATISRDIFKPFKEMGPQMGLFMNGDPNTPRPPDVLNAPSLISNMTNYQYIEVPSVEKENFLDANDQVGDGSSDSDMEVVKETPNGVL
ncbi:zinc ion binding / nucleic acid binding protein [Trifolium repens]|nr:zinc ion binding / nucleic acid binding protein [Trifolium repens]